MNLTPDSMLAGPQQIVADLRCELDECRSERDTAQQKVNDKTTERDAALARETAMAEVLDAINRSPGDFELVFHAMLRKAHTLCEASFGALARFHGLANGISVGGSKMPRREPSRTR